MFCTSVGLNHSVSGSIFCTPTCACNFMNKIQYKKQHRKRRRNGNEQNKWENLCCWDNFLDNKGITIIEKAVMYNEKKLSKVRLHSPRRSLWNKKRAFWIFSITHCKSDVWMTIPTSLDKDKWMKHQTVSLVTVKSRVLTRFV